MRKDKIEKKGWFRIPPWIILGAVIVLVPIFLFITIQNIAREKEFATELLLEKGAALIRSFEAGTRTGMMGMMGMQEGGFQLQNLLTETAQQTDIVYLIVTDTQGTVLAHNDPAEIGKIHGRDLNLDGISRSEKVHWRQVSDPNGASTFEVFRRFSPARGRFPEHHRRMMRMMPNMFRGPGMNPESNESFTGHIIFVGLDMGPIEAARKADTRHTVIMALILLLIGFAGIVSLFLAQAYRSAKTSLTRIKAFSDNVVENMPIGLLAIDTDKRIVSFNQTAEWVLQVRAHEVLGKKADEILPRQLECLTGELETEEEVIEKEIECPVANGRRIPMDVSVSRLEDDDGTSMGHIILFRDLTEIQELKREVERTQRLASLGRLAAGIAHEIRNPLSSIKGFATYFRERYRDVPEDQKTAEIMVQEVERLNRVIGQLLEFARPMSVRKQPTSIQTVIQHSLKMIERDAQAKNISIRTNLSPEIQQVSIDPDRMNQVFLNLYLNGIEAMEDGGTLSVELHPDQDENQIKIAVSDTGTGINKEDLVHVFDPYFTTKQSGTGLGLAIVHKIIESHKGEVKVESVAGKGTTVTIILPFGA
ncbi:MAG: PAS domain-containing protein [Deltaproteobacteria bacterium]|nr:MAG: PAS domain-containing protein [Deltaproteobacteria bacterium]